jgi:protein-disulfide isomerase
VSRKNLDGRPAARGPLRRQHVAERVQTERAQARRRAVAVTGCAVAVLVMATAVGIAWQSGRSRPYDAATDAPAGTTGAGNLSIPLGMPAPATLTVYEDPRCPACGRFEQAFHATIDRLERQGRVRVQYRIVSSIDRHDHGHGSKNAANALACAANEGRFAGLHDLLYARQPDESDDAWASAQTLTRLATQIPGLATPAFRDCVDKDAFGTWVAAVQGDFDRSGFTATPTVLLNGIPAYPAYRGTPATPDRLASWVQAVDGSTP